MAWFEGMLRGIRQRFPSLWIEALSPSEIVALAAASGLDLRQTIARLGDAGLDSIASDDAASLDAANFGNRIAQPQCSLAEWLAVHRAAHGLGMRTVATMVFGAGERWSSASLFLKRCASSSRRRAASPPSFRAAFHRATRLAAGTSLPRSSN